MTTITEDATKEAPIHNEEHHRDVSRKSKRDSLMARLISESESPPQAGDLVEGPVIAVHKSSVFIDLPPFGTGIIYGREFLNASDILRKVHLGDTVAAKVVDPEGREGYVELSLKEARQALSWSEAEHAIAAKKTFEVPVKEANKGGLILEWQGIQGFLPASQLKSEHYPRVEDGSKERILEELKKLIGERLSVSIITADAKEGKLIFSEKDPSKLPWKELDIDIVVESTGAFTTYAGAQAHLDAGAKRVVVTAPMKDSPVEGVEGATVLMGVNANELEGCLISSNASCTTNAASPIISILSENPGIEKAMLSTVHGYTATQNLVDGPSRSHDVRRGRAAAANIVPSSVS